MAKVKAKFVNLDANTLEDASDAIAVLLDPAGELESSGDGIRIASGAIGSDRLADEADIGFLSQNETVSGSWEFDNEVVVATPTLDNHAATKGYVDAAIQGIKALETSARAATAAALPACTYDNGASGVGATLTGNSNGALAAQDGITLDVDQVLLVKDQAAPAQNGVYVLTQVGDAGTPFILTRHAGMDEAADVPAAFIFVEEGTANADSGWLCTTNGAVTMGTTAINWVQFSGAGQITAGAGLTKTGNTIDVVATDTSITVGANSIGVNVDNSTIEISSGIRVKDGGITTAKIGDAQVTKAKIENVAADKLLGRGNGGGAGAPQEITLGTGLSMSGTTLNATASGSRAVETFTLDSTAISNKYVTLAATPSAAGRVLLTVKGAGSQHYGDDYQMSGGNPDRLTWDSLALEALLAEGDKLTVEYD